MTAVLAAMEPVDFRVVWEVDLLAIPVQAFLIIPGGHFPGGGGCGGGPGGPPGGPPDGHGGGLLGGLHGGGGQLPGWLNGVMAGQEAVRTVELPELQDLATAEQDMGPLLAGDWMMMISPFMSDLSSSSSAWWQEVLRVANECYQRWLNADPLERLRLLPEP